MNSLAKRLGIFSLVFVAVFIVSYVVFVRAFSGMSESNTFLQDPFFASVLFFLFFIGAPLAAAYYATNKVFGRKEESNRRQKLLFILSSILLGLFLLGGFLFMSQPRYAPYSLLQVDESEFLIPSPVRTDKKHLVVLSRTVNGNTYQIIEDPPEKDLPSVFRLYHNEQMMWSRTVPGTHGRMRDFWFDEKTNTLFLIEGRGSDIAGDEYQQIMAYTYKEGDETFLEAKMLSFERPGLYSGTSILGYVAERDMLLLISQGGDGCAGWGSVWSFVGNIRRSIQGIGAGCYDANIPRFVGYTGEWLVFALQDPSVDWGLEYATISISERRDPTFIAIYIQDPLSLQKATVLEGNQMLEGITGISLDESDSNMLLLWQGGNVSHRFDLATRTLMNKDVGNIE